MTFDGSCCDIGKNQHGPIITSNDLDDDDDDIYIYMRRMIRIIRLHCDVAIHVLDYSAYRFRFRSSTCRDIIYIYIYIYLDMQPPTKEQKTKVHTHKSTTRFTT
jgi:hypothetical protein